MNSLLYLIALAAISLLSTWWIFRYILKIAVLKNIVDNPNNRKLQRYPIPVLGGVAVFFGIIVSIICSQIFVDISGLFPIIGVMIIMLYVGTMDDILTLSSGMKFLIEVVAVLLFICGNDCSINNWHGLWGVDLIPDHIAIPLTIIASVGIVNAINMIDGVDGLMAGYCIAISCIFGVIFFNVGELSMALMAMIAVGAMVPFFMHNVFGKKSKMFLGDGGSLMIGMMMSVFVIYILKDGSLCSQKVSPSFGLIPFSLATLSIPVFDTLRVMTSRIIHGISPWQPDKTHLHHMFIGLGFSHFGTVCSIVLLNWINVFVWWCSYKLGGSVDIQLIVVVFMSVLNTFGIYKIVYWQKKSDTRIYHILLKIGDFTHVERTGIWRHLEKIIDLDVK